MKLKLEYYEIISMELPNLVTLKLMSESHKQNDDKKLSFEKEGNLQTMRVLLKNDQSILV